MKKLKSFYQYVYIRNGLGDRMYNIRAKTISQINCNNFTIKSGAGILCGISRL